MNEPTATQTVVVVDHEGGVTRTLMDGLADSVRVVGVTNVEEAELAMRREMGSVLVCRDDLPGETGIMFLTRYRDIVPWQRRILLCPPVDSELAMMLINETNVFRCVAMPTEDAILVQIVEAALHESARIEQLFAAETENVHLRQKLQAAQASRGPIRNWLIEAPRLVSLVLITFASIFGLGVVTLLALYLIKSILGIDLIPGAHLSDALP